jgi:preprotein translocase subunit SecF
MTRLLAVIGLLVVCGVALAFYYGYFHLGADSAAGTSHIILTVDTVTADQKKTPEEEKKSVEKVQEKQ